MMLAWTHSGNITPNIYIHIYADTFKRIQSIYLQRYQHATCRNAVKKILIVQGYIHICQTSRDTEEFGHGEINQRQTIMVQKHVAMDPVEWVARSVAAQ